MSENKNSEKSRKNIKLTEEDIAIIENQLSKDQKVEIYRVQADTIAIAALNRKRIK